MIDVHDADDGSTSSVAGATCSLGSGPEYGVDHCLVKSSFTISALMGMANVSWPIICFIVLSFTLMIQWFIIEL